MKAPFKERFAEALIANLRALAGPAQSHRFTKPSTVGIGGNADRAKKTCAVCDRPARDPLHVDYETRRNEAVADGGPSKDLALLVTE